MHLFVLELDFKGKMRLRRYRFLRPELGKVHVFDLFISLQEHEFTGLSRFLVFVVFTFVGGARSCSLLVHSLSHAQSLKEESWWLLDIQRCLVQDEEFQVSLHTGEAE